MITSRTCTQCSRTLRLVDFRRYFGTKLRLFETCNACCPEKANEPPPPAAIARLHPAQTKRTRTQIENAERRRIAHWRRLIIEPLLAAREAAAQARGYAAKQHARYAKDFVLGPLYANWHAFFETYATVLHDMTYRARVTLHNRHGIKHPVIPSLDDQNLLNYLRTPETLFTLHSLYERCVQPPKGKPYKAPWFLRWEQEDDERREAAAQAALDRVAQRARERAMEDKGDWLGE